MTITNHDAFILEAKQIRRDEDYWDRLDALSADYDEASPDLLYREARMRDPLLFGASVGEWQDARDQDREDDRERDRRESEGFRWTA